MSVGKAVFPRGTDGGEAYAAFAGTELTRLRKVKRAGVSKPELEKTAVSQSS
jgi:hypothetical protein